MADVNDPFTPGQLQEQLGEGYEKLKLQWDSFLADPKNVAATMSIGMALAQPPRWGDSGLSAATRALGAGGESVRQIEELDRKERELTSKEGLRESQATAAELRALQAGTASQTAEARIDLQRRALDIREQQARINAQLRLGTSYEGHLRSIRTNNQRIEAENTRRGLLGEPPVPLERPLSRDEWVRQHSFLGGVSTDVEGGGRVPSVTPTSPTTPPASTAPRTGPVPPPNEREVDTIYQTPRGPMRWTGTGWVNP